MTNNKILSQSSTNMIINRILYKYIWNATKEDNFSLHLAGCLNSYLYRFSAHILFILDIMFGKEYFLLRFQIFTDYSWNVFYYSILLYYYF
jgi:hypothetical protein